MTNSNNPYANPLQQPGQQPSQQPGQQPGFPAADGTYGAGAVPPQEPKKKKKGGCFKWGAGALAVLVIIGVATGAGGNKEDTAADNPTSVVPEGGVAQESDTSGDPNAPVEHRNALRKANQYIKTMNFSQAKLYDQLTSEYGEKFPADAAQYAIDNVEADWNAEALGSAESYIKTMAFSKAKLYDQLTSDYGEKFTAEQAQYAVDNVEADWNAEAAESARNYQDTMGMSGAALIDQLTSDYGEKFTYEEAQQAVDQLGM
ncbi:Ltp family lipoprotein [Corynebacterium striatum]|uniref:Ltp family lipoprotein n=1 Tax=Corynebacterium striatum TaxID=43770 RepID=UPI003B59AD86